MTYSMIERVARAISDPEIWNAGEDWRYPWFLDEREKAMVRARAAIEAMREPTEAMLLAAEHAEELGDDPAYKHWRAMIAAALS